MFDDLSYTEIGAYLALVVLIVSLGLWYYHGSPDLGFVLGVFAAANSTKSNVSVAQPIPAAIIPLVVVNTSATPQNTTIEESHAVIVPALPARQFKYVPSWVATPLPIKECYHGLLANNSNGTTVCTRYRGGEEQRNYTSWLENQTAYNITNGLLTYLNVTSYHYAYFQENCTNVTEPYFWDGAAFIVNSTHPLSCDEIKAWDHNSMMNGGIAG